MAKSLCRVIPEPSYLALSSALGEPLRLDGCMSAPEPEFQQLPKGTIRSGVRDLARSAAEILLGHRTLLVMRTPEETLVYVQVCS